MKFKTTKTTIVTFAVFFSANMVLASTDKTVAQQATTSKVSSNVAIDKSQKAPTSKLIDINSAKKAELLTLPGIGDLQAEKIIAGRPYGSKAHLVTRNIVERESYNNISRLVIAKPTRQLLDKAAALEKKKE